MGSTRLLLLLTTFISVAYGIGDGVSTESNDLKKQQQHEEVRLLQGGDSIRSGTLKATTSSGTNPTTASGGTKRNHHVYPYTDDNCE